MEKGLPSLENMNTKYPADLERLKMRNMEKSKAIYLSLFDGRNFPDRFQYYESMKR